MHVSLAILAECVIGLDLKVLACEERRGIACVEQLGNDDPQDNVLYIARPSDIGVARPRHLIVLSDEPLSGLEDIPNLALVNGRVGADVVFAEVSRAFVSLSNWDSRMLEAVAARQGVDAVLAIAAEQIDNPIALFDTKLTLLAYAGDIRPGVVGTIWDEVLLNGFTPLEYYTREERHRITQLFRRSWPFVIRPSSNPEHENLSKAILVDGEMIGTIGLVDINAPFTPGQIALVDLVGERLQLALSLRLGNGPSETDTSYLLRSVLNGNKADKGLIAYHLSSLGWSAGNGFRVILCPIMDKPDAGLESNAQLKRIQSAWKSVIALAYEEGIVILAQADGAEPPKAFLSVISAFGLTMVESEPFADIADARIAYEQCLLAAAACGAGRVRFSDAFDVVLPRAIEQGCDSRVLCDGRVLTLATHGFKGDVERGRGMVRELYVYLMRGCNSREAARELFMHRNTLVYHIGLLEELLGVKLAELSCAQTLFLEVSCLVALKG